MNKKKNHTSSDFDGISLEEFFEKVGFENGQQMTKKREKLPNRQRAICMKYQA